jgi:hypothetical protein
MIDQQARLALVVAVVAVGCCSGPRRQAGPSEPATAGTRQGEVSVAAGSAPDAAPRPAEHAAAPAIVTEHIDTLDLRIGIQPHRGSAGPGSPSLRSLLLAVGMRRLEPPALWPDGTPVSADASLTPAEGSAVVAILAERGFFEAAGRFYSERRPSPDTSPPSGASAGLPETPDDPNVQVRVDVHDEDWYHVFVQTLPWDARATDLVRSLRAQIGAEPVRLVDRLLDQMPAM